MTTLEPARPAGRRVTIDDVARDAGVSRSTVSKVFNHRPGIPQQTADRVRNAADNLGWFPSSSAAALASATTRTIGMVFSRDPDLLIIDPHFAVLIAGAESVLAPRGYGLQLHMVGEDPVAEAEAFRRLGHGRIVDGVLLAESRVDDFRYELLRSLGLPAVLMGRPQHADEIVSVFSDDPGRGLVAAARHLVELGHQRVAYVSGPPDRVHTGYRRGIFIGELARLGVGLGWSITTSFTEEEAAAAALRLMEEAAPPTVIVFANDSMAIAAIGALQRSGRDVPNDVSILGHDDLPFGKWIHPSLTTVSQDLHQIGRSAAIALLRELRIETEPVPPIDSPALVIRASTGSPRRSPSRSEP